MSKELPFNNPKQYQKCATPFPTVQEADAAVQAFWDEVYELRNKHGIANISFVIYDEIAESGPFFICNHIGDSFKQEPMAAFLFGQAGAARQKLVREMAESGLDEAIKSLKPKR